MKAPPPQVFPMGTGHLSIPAFSAIHFYKSGFLCISNHCAVCLPVKPLCSSLRIKTPALPPEPPLQMVPEEQTLICGSPDNPCQK